MNINYKKILATATLKIEQDVSSMDNAQKRVAALEVLQEPKNNILEISINCDERTKC